MPIERTGTTTKMKITIINFRGLLPKESLRILEYFAAYWRYKLNTFGQRKCVSTLQDEIDHQFSKGHNLHGVSNLPEVR